MTLFKSKFFGLALTSALAVTPAMAGDILEDMVATWSGVSQGNSATATAHLTLDLTQIGTTPNISSGPIATYVTSLSLTISGATSGNGTFTRSAFSAFNFASSQALDFNSEIVGQPGLLDFYFTTTSPANPTGGSPFKLTTLDGLGNKMILTSLAPAPEPGTLALVGLGLAGFAGICFCRRRAAFTA